MLAEMYPEEGKSRGGIQSTETERNLTLSASSTALNSGFLDTVRFTAPSAGRGNSDITLRRW